jgi:UDP-glucose 4-epimerase
MEFFGTGAETRDWLHAQDAANLLVKAAEHASAGEPPVVNGAAGQKVTVSSILRRIAELMDKEPALQFCGTQRPGDPVDYHADMRAAAAWNWSPQIDLQDGLAAYVAWFESQEGRADSSRA